MTRSTRFSYFLFLRATRLRYNLEKTKRKIRENNEHLVNRPFTSNSNEQISHVFRFTSFFKQMVIGLVVSKKNGDCEAICKERKEENRENDENLVLK